VKLRDQRNGGWFWAQNELFDVFQPLIGVHGVSVYMTMCRQLGDPKSNGRLSLRDISRASGVSKSEVGRARAAMVVLGMIAEKATGTNTPSSFELLDLRAAAEVGPEELQRRLTLSETRELPSETVPTLKAGTVRTVPPRGSLERNRQHSRGSPPNATVPPRDSLAGSETVLSPGRDSFAAQSELFNTKTNTERENTGAREVLDLVGLAGLIVIAHPRAKLRGWTERDVQVADRMAAVEAARAEAELVASSPEDAALAILNKIERIAREVPRDQWRFLKEPAKFLQLREYRMRPGDLYRSVVEAGAGKRAEATVGMAPQPRRDDDDARDVALGYWRRMRDKGQPIYEREAPRWAKALLDAEKCPTETESGGLKEIRSLKEIHA